MINRLCIVLAHGGAVETVKRHLPIWAKFHDRTIVCSPADDPLNLPGEWGFVNGKSSKYAADTNLRARAAMTLALEIGPRYLTVCEYDALLWDWPSKLIDQTFTIGGRAMGSVFHSADPSFLGKNYIHSPIIFDRVGYYETTKAMHKLPDDAERGFGDRMFGLAIERAGVTLIDGHAHGLSYSQNHIERQHYPEMMAKVRAGACFTHGIKDAQALRIGMNAAKIAY